MSIDSGVRLSVANDKHAARPLSCPPPCQVPHRNFRASDRLFMAMLYWNSLPLFTTIFVCSIYAMRWWMVALWCRRLVRPTRWYVVYDFMNPSSPSLGSLPSPLSFLYVLFISLQLIWLESKFCSSATPSFLEVGFSVRSSFSISAP